MKGLWARSGLSLALLMAGAAAHAGPTYFSQTDRFTLETQGQGMFGAGQAAGWAYDSGFQGQTWGRYATPNSPERVTIGGIAGGANETILKPLCVWFPFVGEQCTPRVTLDTRTGVQATLESSGRVGVRVGAAVEGGSISAKVPLEAKLEITRDEFNGTLQVGGYGRVDSRAKLDSMITATAPSFNAGVKAEMALNVGLGFAGCVFAAGCSSSGGRFGFDVAPTLLGVDTAKQNPLTVLDLGLPVPGANKYYEIRKNPNPAEQGSDALDATEKATKPGSDGRPQADSPISMGGVILAQVKADLPRGASGGTVMGSSISLGSSMAGVSVAADLTGLAQLAAGFPVDMLSPSFDISLGRFGSVGLGGTLINMLAGVNLGLSQNFTFTPQLKVELEFDKPVSEYVRRIERYESVKTGIQGSFFFGGFAFGDGVRDAEGACGALAAKTKADYLKAMDAYFRAGSNGDPPPEPPLDQTSCTQKRFVAANQLREGWDGNRGYRLLQPDESLDSNYGGFQCRGIRVSQKDYPWYVDGLTGDLECIAGSMVSSRDIMVDVPVYLPGRFLEDRGNKVWVDLDDGATLKFLNGEGKLLGWKYAMDEDEKNFRSKAALNLGLEFLIRAGCLRGSITAPLLTEIGYEGCMYEDNLGSLAGFGPVGFGGKTVFDQTWNLGGFNTQFFSAGGDSGLEGGGQQVPEAGSLALTGVALLALLAAASRRRRQTAHRDGAASVCRVPGA